MATTLFEYQPYDPVRERRQRIRIIAAVVVILTLAALLWLLRFWPEEHRVDGFFAALQAKNYEQAYSVWMNDPAGNSIRSSTRATRSAPSISTGDLVESTASSRITTSTEPPSLPAAKPAAWWWWSR